MPIKFNSYALLIFLLLCFSCYKQSKLDNIDSSIQIDTGYHENGVKSYEISYKYGKLDGVLKIGMIVEN